jgi:hypothetical protein
VPAAGQFGSSGSLFIIAGDQRGPNGTGLFAIAEPAGAEAAQLSPERFTTDKCGRTRKQPRWSATWRAADKTR